MEDVRDALFDTLDKLRKKEMDIETAKAVQGVSQALLNSARLELDFLRHSDQCRSKFFETEEITKSIGEAKDQLKLTSRTEEKKDGIDKPLEEIEQNRTKPYKFDNKER